MQLLRKGLRQRAVAWPGAALGLGVALMLPGAALAVPKADHVRVEVAALRLSINDYCTRYQVKVLVTVSSSEEGGLDGVKDAGLTVANPAGAQVALSACKVEIIPKRFKAATAQLLFKAGEDTSSAALSNVPRGFFGQDGTYCASVRVRGQQYAGEFRFGAMVSLSAEQAGKPVEHFSLKDEEPLRISTEPGEFGPVYYKRQDLMNFMFMLNNMDQAIQSGNYHPEVESPMYVFQVRIGDAQGGPARLLDPARYIEGHQPFLIRSDHTSTPLVFSAEEFSPGDVVIVDFMRQDTLQPDEGFTCAKGGFSGQITVQNRAVYAMAVESAPSAAELGEAASSTEEDMR
jgi:hypothetical protein